MSFDSYAAGKVAGADNLNGGDKDRIILVAGV